MLTPDISIMLLYMIWLTHKLKYNFRLWNLASETIKIKTCNIEAHWRIFKEKICRSEKGHAVGRSISYMSLFRMCHHIWKSKHSSGWRHKVLCSNLWIYKAAVSPAGCWQNSWCGRNEQLEINETNRDWISSSFTRLGSNTLLFISLTQYEKRWV